MWIGGFFVLGGEGGGCWVVGGDGACDGNGLATLWVIDWETFKGKSSCLVAVRHLACPWIEFVLVRSDDRRPRSTTDANGG